MIEYRIETLQVSKFVTQNVMETLRRETINAIFLALKIIFII